jgi:hypothetical protein
MNVPIPHVVLSIRLLADGGCILQISARENKVRPVMERIPSADVRAAAAAARESLRDSVRWGAIGERIGRQDPSSWHDALFRAGNSLLMDLVGPNVAGGPLDKIRTFFSQVRTAFGGGTLRLEMKSPIDLPIEIIPVRAGRPDFHSLRGDELLAKATSYFLGLQFAISRILPSSQVLPQSLMLQSGPSGKVTIAPFAHRDFVSIRKLHAEFHASESGRYTVLPLLPDEKNESDLNVDRFADLLMQAGSNAIVSIAAHGIVDGRAANDVGLLFWGKPARDVVTVGHLNASMAALPPRAEVPTGPLGILNCCGIAHRPFDAPSNVVDAFVRAGYRSVLAPVVPINIPMAANFTRLVLTELLADETTLEDALLRSRRALIRDWSNPVGLLYVAYGATRIQAAHT